MADTANIVEIPLPGTYNQPAQVQPPAQSQYSQRGAQSLPTRRIRVLGVPLDLGASRRGVDMGPSAVRVAGLEARLEALEIGRAHV